MRGGSALLGSAPRQPTTPEGDTLRSRRKIITDAAGGPGRGPALADAPAYWFERACRRFVLIANDERISAAGVERLQLQPSDVLVQFNKALHLDAFGGLACHKVFVFQKNGRGFYWGFDEEGRILPDVLGQQRASATMVFTMRIIDLVSPFIASLPPDAKVLCFKPGRIPLFTVPKGKVPSVGFISLSYFHHVNYLRQLDGTGPAEIVTLGFTGAYSVTKGFQGHDFRFEQAVMATWPDVTRLDFDGEPFAPEEWGPLNRPRSVG